MLSKEQIKAMRRGVNCALGLPDAHGLGHNFIDHFVVRQAETDDRLRTTYDGLCSWCDAYDYKYLRPGEIKSTKYRMTPKRYQILIGILECLQAVLRVELLNEGGDLPEPPSPGEK